MLPVTNVWDSSWKGGPDLVDHWNPLTVDASVFRLTLTPIGSPLLTKLLPSSVAPRMPAPGRN
jgi:hypothetical protein